MRRPHGSTRFVTVVPGARSRTGGPRAARARAMSVIVRLAAPVDAATDEDRCERREYWLARPAGDLLLAVDCEAQWGAENAGPASLSLAGNLATFRYVEFLADNTCEIVEATLRLPEGRISTHTRHFGTVVGNQCRASRKVAPIPAPGCGTPDNPVLVLHRP